jgi:hypothetical protein
MSGRAGLLHRQGAGPAACRGRKAVREAAGLRVAEVVHVKLAFSVGGETLACNVTGMVCTPFFRGDLSGQLVEVDLVINARIHSGPALLRELIEGSVARVAQTAATEVNVRKIEWLSPSRPETHYRYEAVVSATP